MTLDTTMPVDISKSLARFTNSKLIVPKLKNEDRNGVVQELCHLLELKAAVPQLFPFYHATLNREFVIQTSTDVGIAFPHARMGKLTNPCFALGKSHQPIRWGEGENSSVRLIFLMVVPSDNATDYLQFLSGMSRFGKNSRSVDELLKANKPNEMFEVLEQVSLGMS